MYSPVRLEGNIKARKKYHCQKAGRIRILLLCITLEYQQTHWVYFNDYFKNLCSHFHTFVLKSLLENCEKVEGNKVEKVA